MKPEIGQYCIIGKQPRYATTSISAGKEKIYPPVEFGNNVIVGDRVSIYAGCKIGNNTYIADGVSIREGCVIGDNCIIGRSVVIESHVHVGNNTKIQALSMVHVIEIGNNVFIGPMFNTAADKGFTSGKLTFQKIHDDVKIGSGVLLMPGVDIGKGSCIGAGSLVTKDIPAGETWYGRPAKKKIDTESSVKPECITRDNIDRAKLDTIRQMSIYYCGLCNTRLGVKLTNSQFSSPRWICLNCDIVYTTKDIWMPGMKPIYILDNGKLVLAAEPPKVKDD